MKQQYTISALIYPPSQPVTAESSTGIETHRSTHAAGIPEFHLEEYRLTCLKISFKSAPDPMFEEYPHPTAKNAALRQLKAEIRAKYKSFGEVKFNLEQKTP